ncbi:MAG: CoA protein activase [Candidatus Lokiarchaeota archaeon]|nr:CoA protein activase [Candidatus Lokiarchaeota archaeon]
MSKLQVSFPNMGNCWVAFKTLVESVPDIEVVLPPPVTRKTIELGAKYSPEFVCFPFKVNIGDFIQTYEQYGIDTFVNAIDCGPCRFGFYHAVQERILRDLGYDLKIIPLDQADLLNFNWVKTFDEFYKIMGVNDPFKKFFNTAGAAINFLRKAKITADFEKLEGYYRCRELSRGDTSRVLRQALQSLDEAKTPAEIRESRKKGIASFKKIPHDTEKDPLKVTLTGEIHVTLEPYVNLDLRKKLGDMGIEVHQNLSLIDWILHKFHVNFHRKELERKAEPFLKLDIGGEAQWVIGEYIESNQRGLDGFIHIYPFTCMPEVTARSIITAMDDPKIPAIFFSFDEHSGVEGMRTRLEAFIDLMEARKRKGSNIKPIKKYREQKSIIDHVIANHQNPIENILEPMGELVNIASTLNPLEVIGNIFSDNTSKTKPETKETIEY